jgi:excisionase family DNA binding protein
MPSRSVPTSALYVRLPAGEAERLDRAAQALGVHKKDLVAGLVSRYVHPETRRGLGELAELAAPRRLTLDLAESELAVGSYSFHEYELPEVLSPVQAAQLLQLPLEVVIGLAESGELPGRKLGGEWRFSKAGIVAWLEASVSGGRPSTKT